jgi:hypothetical protein
MAAEENSEESFEKLVGEAPEAPVAGTISLVGTLARSGEAGLFVLTLQDGSAVTLETASVEGYAVLGAAFGQRIVRVDLDARKIPTISPNPARRDQPNPMPMFRDGPDPLPWSDAAGGAVPFALATAQQVSPDILEALQFPNPFPLWRTGVWDNPQPPKAYADAGATGGPPIHLRGGGVVYTAD